MLDVRIEGQEAIIKMATRHAAELALRKGSTINQQQARASWVQEEPEHVAGHSEQGDEGDAKEEDEVSEFP